MAFLVIAVFFLNVLTLRTMSEVSPIDEREHIDYLLRGSHGRIGQNGDTLTQETLRELCSRGSEFIAWPGCTAGRLNPSDYAIGGINVASDTPFYYLATGLSARAIRAVSPGWESLVTWGRVLGSAWLLLGFYLALRAGDALGLARLPLVLALVLIAALPVQLTAATTITADATAFVAGAALLLTALAWERTGRDLWLVGVGLIAAAAVVFRHTNGVGVLIVLAYFGLRALSSVTGRGALTGALPWRRYALAGAAIGVSVAIALVGWEGVKRLRTPPPAAHVVTPAERAKERAHLDPLRADYGSSDLRVEQVIGGSALFAMFPPVTEAVVPSRRSTGSHAAWYGAFVTAAYFLMAGALLLCALRLSLANRVTAIGLATIVALLVASPAMQLYNYFVNGYYEPIVPRFGISALPAIALVVAGVARERLAQIILLVASVGLYATALWTLT